MKQVFNVVGKIAVIEVPAPVCGDNEVLLQNMFSVISVGTEVSAVGQGGKGVLDLLSEVRSNPELVRKRLRWRKERG